MLIEWLAKFFEKIDRIAVVVGCIFITGIVVIFVFGSIVLAL